MENEHSQAPPPDGASWTFVTNHGAALLVLADDPDIRIAQLAELLEVSERAALRIVRDLESAGYVEVRKRGRRNSYRVREDAMMRHPTVRGVTVGRLLQLRRTDDGWPGEGPSWT